jgi:pimeloyl-ACP methyl ester carboxylesterase
VPDPTSIPDPIRATVDDLPASLRQAFADPPEGRRVEIEAAGMRWSAMGWGAGTDRPLLLLHGVTASAAIWWRIGPVLAATGRHVVAPDLPGHGRTGGWRGRHRFDEVAADVLAFVDAAGLDRPGLQVVGHSWGAMTAAALPAAGLATETLVLVDPPVLPEAAIARLMEDPTNRAYGSVEAARAVIVAGNPGWSALDIDAKAEALAQLQLEAARAVLLRNGDWDGGLTSLAHPAATDVPIWLVRGEERTGSFVPDAAVPALAARTGADRFLTLAGAPHAPQRTHPEALLVALLRALDS